MLYVFVREGGIIFPYTITDFRHDNPNVSMRDNPDNPEALAQHGMFVVKETPPPEYAIDKIALHSAQLVDNEWVEVWMERDATKDEIAARMAVTKERLVTMVRDRLNVFAMARGYDGILEAVSYAGDDNPAFDKEGSYCRDVRSRSWTKLFEILAEIEAGKRPAPTDPAEIEKELPELTWPD